MLYAMIDVGSNTIRMAIYEIDGDRVEMLMKRKHTPSGLRLTSKTAT